MIRFAPSCRGWPRGSAPTGSSSCWSGLATPGMAIWPPTSPWCSPGGSAPTRGRPPSGCSQELQLPPIWSSKTEIAGPGFINFWLAETQLAAAHRRILDEGADYGRAHVGRRAQGQRGVRLRQPDRPAARRARPRRRAGRRHRGAARVDRPRGHPRVLRQRRRRPDRQAGAEPVGPGAGGARAEPAEFPKAAITGSTAGERARSVPSTEGAGVRRPRRPERRPRARAAGARGSSARSRTATCEISAWGSTSISSEQAIYDRGRVERALELLAERGLTYEAEGALWLRTTEFGDDKDRVLRKSDGTYTYLVPDIAYHVDKQERGFDRVIDVWGADHHGYIPRMRAALQALGYPAGVLRRGAGAAGEGGAGRRRGEDVEAVAASSSPCGICSTRSASTRRATSSCCGRATRS